MNPKKIGIEQKKEHVLTLLSLWNLHPSHLRGHNSESKATSTLLTWLIGPDVLLFFFFWKEHTCVIQDKILSEIASSPSIYSVNKQPEIFSMV